MAIKYLDSKRIVKLSSDVAIIPTFEDDFTGSSSPADWNPVGVPDIYVNAGLDKLVVKMDRTNTNNKVAYDLGAGNVSDTDWVLRYHKVNFSVVGASNAYGYSGISSTDQDIDSHAGSQYFIGLIWNDNGEVNRYGTVYANNQAIPGLNNTGSYQTTYTPSTGVNYWVEIKRSNDTMTITWFTDEFLTSAWSISQAVPSAVAGLRYLTFQNPKSNTSDVPIQFTVDQVDFYNGEQSTKNKPTNVQDNSILVEKDTANRFWFSEATPKAFEDDFSGTDDWDDAGTRFGVNTGTDKFDFNAVNDGTNDASVHDLGSGNVSDTAWVLRAEVNFSTITPGESCFLYMVMGASNQAVPEQTVQKFIGVRLMEPNNATKRYDTVFGNTAKLDATKNNQYYTFLENTPYYLELIRTGADTFTMEIFTGSFGGTSLGKISTSGITGLTGLQYIKFANRTTGGASGAYIGTIDNVEFYNSVTSLTPAKWNMEPTYEYDMTTDPRTNTFDTSGVTTITHANSTLQMNQINNTASMGASTYIDLGSALSNKWVMRFRTKQSEYTSYMYNSHLMIGMSSVAPTSTAYAIPNTNWIGFRWYFGTQFNSPYVGIEPRIGQNANDSNHSNSTARLYGKPNETTNTTTSYYHEYIWNVDTFTYNLYDNANYTGTKLATAIISSSSNTNWVSGTPSSVSGLRYLVFKEGADSNGGLWVNQLDDVKIYDGVTSV